MRDQPPHEDALTKATRWAAGDDPPSTEDRDDAFWVNLSRQAHSDATDWIDSGVRKQWDRAISLFQSQHPSDSKYHAKEYRGRSKLFRPKTRSAIRRGEAQAAAAFFSNAQQCNIEPLNDSNQMAAASAQFWQPIIEYRLDRTIPWFLTLVGAMQDGQTVGVAIAKTHWRYEETQDGEEPDTYVDPETGQTFNVLKKNPAGEAERVMKPRMKVTRDEPAIDLIPAENVRVSAAADWRNPVQTSPYFQHEEPMFAGDLKAKIKASQAGTDKTGMPKLRDLSDSDLSAGRKNTDDQTTARRERPRQDPRVAQVSLGDHEIVWVRHNFMRVDGVDHYYMTVGDSLLSDPVTTETVWRHKERPYVMGYVVFETHKTYPASKATLGEPLQQEANDIQNLRLDKLKMSLTPRAKVVAGSKVPLDSLRNGAAGEPIMVNKLTDFEWEQPPSVDAAAFAEQDRLNVDMDELLGSFSQGSVMTNRRMNETVGGMNLVSGAAGTISEYDLRVFTITFVEPVLRQLLKIEQAYETDLTILALGTEKFPALRYGIAPITDELLNQDLLVRVNVGIGATDPKQKIERLLMGFQALSQVTQAMAQGWGPGVLQSEAWKNVAGEIFGALGYKDPARFLPMDMPPGGGQQQMDPKMIGAMAAAKISEERHQQEMRQRDEKAQLDNRITASGAELDAALKAYAAQQDAVLQAFTTKVEAQLNGVQRAIDMQAKMGAEGPRTKIVVPMQNEAHQHIGEAVQALGEVGGQMRDMMQQMSQVAQEVKGVALAAKDAADTFKRPREIQWDDKTGRPVRSVLN